MITNYSATTIKLYELMKNETTKNLLNQALSKYPLYAPKKIYDLIPSRDELNQKILNHYKHYEIGSETVGRFLDDLEITMNEIMPYYNEMFKTVETMAELPSPFDNVDVTETFEEERSEHISTEGTANNTSNSTSTNETESEQSVNKSELVKNKFSDTPQNNVGNIDNYLTTYAEQNATETNGSTGTESNTNTANGESVSSSEGVSDTTATTKHTYKKIGNQGVNTYAHDMNEFRTSIIDVVDKIIRDERLRNLFMLVW